MGAVDGMYTYSGRESAVALVSGYALADDSAVSITRTWGVSRGAHKICG